MASKKDKKPGKKSGKVGRTAAENAKDVAKGAKVLLEKEARKTQKAAAAAKERADKMARKALKKTSEAAAKAKKKAKDAAAKADEKARTDAKKAKKAAKVDKAAKADKAAKTDKVDKVSKTAEAIEASPRVTEPVVRATQITEHPGPLMFERLAPPMSAHSEPEPPSDPKSTSGVVPSESWTVTALRARARAQGIPNYSRLTKPELLERLK